MKVSFEIWLPFLGSSDLHLMAGCLQWSPSCVDLKGAPHLDMAFPSSPSLTHRWHPKVLPHLDLEQKHESQRRKGSPHQNH
jgi:hypothetical protein